MVIFIEVDLVLYSFKISFYASPRRAGRGRQAVAAASPHSLTILVFLWRQVL